MKYRYFCFIAIRIHFNITIYTLHTRYVDIQLFQLDNSKSLDDKKVGFRYHQKSIEICLRFHAMKFSALKKNPMYPGLATFEVLAPEAEVGVEWANRVDSDRLQH